MRPQLLLVALAATPLVAFAAVTSVATAPPAPTLQDEEEGPVRPAEGDPAPSIRLNDQDGKAASIGGDTSADSTDWTVVAFFPKAATPG